jgi:hypothetical protein
VLGDVAGVPADATDVGRGVTVLEGQPEEVQAGCGVGMGADPVSRSDRYVLRVPASSTAISAPELPAPTTSASAPCGSCSGLR